MENELVQVCVAFFGGRGLWRGREVFGRSGSGEKEGRVEGGELGWESLRGSSHGASKGEGGRKAAAAAAAGQEATGGLINERRTLPEVPVVEVEKSASKTGSFLPTMTKREIVERWVCCCCLCVSGGGCGKRRV